MSTVTKEASWIFSEKLVFFINGKKIEDHLVNPEWTLQYYLRYKRLCGTKIGCKQGGCGSCTVMVSRYDRQNEKVVHFPVNSCLTPICSVHGQAVTTVEGIGSTGSQLHPVQERIAKAHGSQCGYCTPGMVMSMYTLLRQNPKPKMKDVANALHGNLCRCTGYRPIIDGYRTFTEEWDNSYEECKKNTSSQMPETEEKLFRVEEFSPYLPSKDPIFPSELKASDQFDKEYLKIKGPRSTWLRPTSLNHLLNQKYNNLDAKILSGCTIFMFECKYGDKIFPLMVSSTGISEMIEICETIDGIRVGASVTIENIKTFLEKILMKYPEEKTRLFRSVNDIVHWMCSKQIRSVGSIGGNIIMGASSSDLIPILIAGRVQLEIHSKGNSKLITFDSNFSRGFLQNIMRPEEVLVAIHLPFSHKNQYFQVHKQSRRRDVDENIVNLAVKVTLEPNTDTISSIIFGIGGVTAKPIEAPKTQNKLKGLLWTRNTLEEAYSLLLEELNVNMILTKGMFRYRQSLVLSLFFRAFLAISEKLQHGKNQLLVDSAELCGIRILGTTDYRSSQSFNTASETQSLIDLVQRPIVNISAFKQATGEAVFVDDIPKYANELSIFYILSKRAHANIISIDASKALEIKGVHSFFSETDISSEVNKIGRFFKGDEQVFYSKKVTSEGQIIGAILAEDHHIAHTAAKLVNVHYESLEPIITIEDAIKHNSFFKDYSMEFCHGNVEKILKNAPHKITGSCRIRNQKHFYLEMQSCLVIPQTEDNTMEIFSSTQCPTDLVNAAADLLGVPKNKIKVHVKRVGGAFGGKEWKSIEIASPAILAANKFRRPIRCVLLRQDDNRMDGGRTPYLFNYTTGFDNQGKILACDFDIYVNCGCSLEINHLGLKNSLDHLDNAFNIEAIRARGQLCKTNIPSTTTMQGLGATEGQFPTSCIIEEIAEYLRKDPAEVAEINLYSKGDTTFYGQKINDCTIKECWNKCIQSSQYLERRKLIDVFNSENSYKKRGISIVPSKFGIGTAYLPPIFQQAAALVNIYTDGSVLLSYGGVEMGQGLHTKMVQLVTRILNIPAEKIHIGETSTNIVPNCPPTVAYISSDVFSAAVIDACEQLKERLRPYEEANPDCTWEDIVLKAHWNKISLSATGFMKYESEDWDPETGTGNLFDYFVYGAACSEVEVDVLSGDHQVLRTDIFLDIGESLNPAVDIGQIEGAFMQGYGLFVMEETLLSPAGTLITNSLGSYKLPGIGDIPREFNVSLLNESFNPKVKYCSKAVEEPPLILASSVYFGIKDAIKAARAEKEVSTAFHLDNPATAEIIRMACEDGITKLVLEDNKTRKPKIVTVRL